MISVQPSITYHAAHLFPSNSFYNQLLFPPDASGEYFGLAFAMPLQTFLMLMVSVENYTRKVHQIYRISSLEGKLLRDSK